mmetsp:Transcript_19163/g.41629  ORF Transcript_19163/g.41629 Transcript_19163/m.41629 type:complete len:220 (+) Transcript_19163:1732-2391(+)
MQAPQNVPGSFERIDRVRHVLPGRSPVEPFLMKVGTPCKLSGIVGSGAFQKADDENDPVLAVLVRVRRSPMPPLLVQQGPVTGPPRAFLRDVLHIFQGSLLSGIVFVARFGLANLVESNLVGRAHIPQIFVGTHVRPGAEIGGPHRANRILEGQKERIGMTVGPAKHDAVSIGFHVWVPTLALGTGPGRNGGDFRESRIFVPDQVLDQLGKDTVVVYFL